MIETRVVKDHDADIFNVKKCDLLETGWKESTAPITIQECGRTIFTQTFYKDTSNQSGRSDTIILKEKDIDVFNVKLGEYQEKGWMPSGQPMQVDEFGSMMHVITLTKSL